jgi:hypothetical protein
MPFEKRFAFPLLLMALNLGASAFCFIGGDWRRGCYWLASAVCVAMVSFS